MPYRKKPKKEKLSNEEKSTIEFLIAIENYDSDIESKWMNVGIEKSKVKFFEEEGLKNMSKCYKILNDWMNKISFENNWTLKDILEIQEKYHKQQEGTDYNDLKI